MSKDLNNSTKKNIDAAAGAGTSDQIKGKSKEVMGRGKEAIGAATGNDKLRADGIKDQASGKTQKVVGDVKEGAQKVGEKIKDAVRRK